MPDEPPCEEPAAEEVIAEELPEAMLESAGRDVELPVSESVFEEL